jgi:succinyl-diaminopimelate desuccinylase
MDLTDPVELCRSLVRCPSVTPADAGAQAVLGDALRALGFEVEHLRFDAGAEPAIKKPLRQARRGGTAPRLRRHTDVVPGATSTAGAPTPSAPRSGTAGSSAGAPPT